MPLQKSCGRCHLTSLSTFGVTYSVRGVCPGSPPSGRDCQRSNAAEWGKQPKRRFRLEHEAWRAPRLFVFLGTVYLLRWYYVARQLASSRVIAIRAKCTERTSAVQRSRLLGCFLQSAALGRWQSLPLGGELEQTIPY